MNSVLAFNELPESMLKPCRHRRRRDLPIDGIDNDR